MVVRTRPRYKSDEDICGEVIGADCYRLRHIHGLDPGISSVVDLGANIGAFSVFAHRLFPSAQIDAYEMHHANIPLLDRNVSGFATVHHACVTPLRPEEIVIADSRKHGVLGGSYAFPTGQLDELRTDFYSATAHTGQVLCFDELMAAHGHVDLLKLDIESAEDEILRSSATLRRVKWIVGEFHNIDHWVDAIDNVLPNHNKLIERDPKTPTMGQFVMTTECDLSGFPRVFPERRRKAT
jgi:FkbM family methyltransferase